jgi:hypothetical protein
LGENVTALKSEQLKAIEALVTIGTVAAAASAADRAPKTIHTWLKLPEFVAVLREAEAAALDNLSRELVGLAGEAVATLRATMASETASAGIKIRAAEVVLTNLLKLRELYQFEARLAAMEAALENKQ